MNERTDGVTPVPRSLALYLVYQDVAAMMDWLVRTLGFSERGRHVDASGTVTNGEMLAGDTALLLEKGNYPADAYPRGTRWTGVWVDDADSAYRRLEAMNVEALPPEDEPWGVRLVRVVDPEGHVWALIAPLSTRPPRPTQSPAR
jgi:uncharacterized glyoxalase superfamily protein PhnB